MNFLRLITFGFILLVGYAGGVGSLYGNDVQAGGVSWTDSALVTVNLEGYSRYVLRSEPAGTVDQLEVVTPGTVVVTPDLAANPEFGYWTLDGVRQENAWGVALSQLTFTVDATDREAVAYLFTEDSDNDGVSDAYEQRYYGSLSYDANSDTDGDGVTLLGEYTGGTHPRHGNSSQAGGVVWADSAMVTVNLEGYSRYVLRSEPAGTVDQTAVVTTGTEIVTPDLSANASFGYWTLDGVRQENAWGVALSQLTFIVDATDREAVAYLFTEDSDNDGVSDAYEQRYYGTLSYDANSDTDGDGVTLLGEYTGGTDPLYANSTTAGGVTWTDSDLVAVNLEPTLTLEAPGGYNLNDGATQGFGSIRVGQSSTITFTVRNQGVGNLTNLAVTKSGSNSSEFAMISSPVTLVAPDGYTTFSIQFAPISAGAKSAVLHLAHDSSAGNPFDLNLIGIGITIHSSWRESHFTSDELADANISGPSADPDRDGLTNLLEYALGLDPKSSDTAGLPEAGSTATDWTYTYTRPADRDDLTYAVEVSTDLSSWTTVGVTLTPIGTDGDEETWQATYPLSSATNLFFRLKVTQD